MFPVVGEERSPRTTLTRKTPLVKVDFLPPASIYIYKSRLIGLCFENLYFIIVFCLITAWHSFID